MSGYLLDTNIISRMSSSKPPAPAGFILWLEEADAAGLVHLSTVTVHEIEKGIRLLEHKGAQAKAAGLRTWLDGLVSIYADRILPVDTRVSLLSGQMEAPATIEGHAPGMADTLIAGTAKVHGLTIVTENRKHFMTFGVPLISIAECVPGHMA